MPDRPHVIEIIIALLILGAIVFAFSGCTITRGPCSTSKEVKITTSCERDGQVIHTEVLPP